jgi:hypothetical protein
MHRSLQAVQVSAYQQINAPPQAWQQRSQQVCCDDFDGTMHLPTSAGQRVLPIQHLLAMLMAATTHGCFRRSSALCTLCASRVARVAASAGSLISVAMNWHAPPFLAATMRTADVIT